MKHLLALAACAGLTIQPLQGQTPPPPEPKPNTPAGSPPPHNVVPLKGAPLHAVPLPPASTPLWTPEQLEKFRDGHAAPAPTPGTPGSPPLHFTPLPQSGATAPHQSTPGSPYAPHHHAPPKHQAPMKPTAFLGVSTAPVEPALAAQLGLPEGFGLTVTAVVPESPAARAGIERHDVLKLLDDQQLFDPAHLAGLVRARGKDAEVTITLVRQSAEQKITVKLEERLLPEARTLPGAGPAQLLERLFTPRAAPRNMPDPSATRRSAGSAVQQYQESLRTMQKRQEEFQERLKEWEKQLRDWQKNPGASPAPEPPKFEQDHGHSHGPSPDLERLPDPSAGDGSNPGEPLAGAAATNPFGAGAAGQPRKIRSDASTNWNTAQARVLLRDADGEIEVSNRDGRRMIAVRDASGGVIHEGSLDTEEQRRALPDFVQRKLKDMKIEANAAVAPAGTGDGAAAAAAGGHDVQ